MQPICDLKSLGKEISAEFSRQHQALLDGRALSAVQEDDPIYDEIASVFERLTLDYPTTENGSKFIDSRFTLTPRLIVRIADFQSLYQGNSLFPDVVGRTFRIEPIHNEIFGQITAKATNLIIRNVKSSHRKSTSKDIKQQTKKVATLMTELDMRPNDPKRKIWQMVADVTFGKFYTDTVELQSTTGKAASFVITLPSLEGEIEPNGTVYLPNGASFSMEELLGSPVCWVSHTHSEDLDIEVTL